MRHSHPVPVLLALVVLAACRGDQSPTAPTPPAEPDGPAFSHTAGHKVVNSLADPGDGTCTVAQCTLREAINDPGSTEISFAPGLTGPITLARPGAGGGMLTINKTLSITGPSQRIVIRRRSTDPNFRIFLVGTGGPVTLSNLIMRGGKLSEPGGAGISNTGTLRLINSVVAGNSAVMHGGGILNFLGGTLRLINSTVSGNTSSEFGGGINNNGEEATLTLTNSVVAGNSASRFGGGIWNAGTLTLTDSRVSNNSSEIGGGINNNGLAATLTLTNSTVSGNAGDGGGGIENTAGRITLTNSTITGNTASSFGGGISNRSGGTTLISSTVSGNSSNIQAGGILNLEGRLNLTNSTVSRNSAASGDGGGILIIGTTARVKLRNATVAHNSATQGGGGIRTSGPLILSNSLVARNTAPQGPDVLKTGGVTITARFSLLGIGNGSGVSDGVDGNQVGSNSNPLNPKLGPLADNGGPTRTHALLLGSPAIDAASTPGCPTNDQRGVLRPQGAACDIGSYERE
jgi:CSLREA domain-containing protein